MGKLKENSIRGPPEEISNASESYEIFRLGEFWGVDHEYVFRIWIRIDVALIQLRNDICRNAGTTLNLLENTLKYPFPRKRSTRDDSNSGDFHPG